MHAGPDRAYHLDSPHMADLEARAKRVLSPVLGHYSWLPVDRGEGSWLVLDGGRRVLDLTCGIAVTPIGHAHPKVVAAVVAQALRSGIPGYRVRIIGEDRGTIQILVSSDNEERRPG